MERLFERPKLGALFLAGMGALGLTACANDPEVTPNVPAVVQEHLYDDRDVIHSVILVGKVPVSTTRIDPEHFYLDVSQCGHEEFKPENSDGCGVIRVEVDATTYATYQDGQTITFKGKE